MAETLLSAVNRVLKKVKVIQGEDGELTSLTESARQTYIDLAVSSINELIQELYTTTATALPTEAATDTITLVDGQREYDLPVDFLEIHWPLINETLGDQIFEFPGGFDAMRRLQTIPDQHTGLALTAVISPINRKLRLEQIPTSDEAGNVYTLTYDKSLLLVSATDTFPFVDDVVIAMVPAVAELWKRSQRSSFDAGLFQANLGRAARLMNPQQPRKTWKSW